MAEKKYQIYLLICLITNMGYVGQTCRDVRIRCRRANYHFGTKIRQALDDYGPDNFVCIILEDGLSKKEADEREQYWISFLHTTEYGYNTSSGGASGANGAHWKYPHAFTDEHLQKLRDAKLGKVATDETREKLSKKFKGRENTWLRKPVLRYSKDGVFIARYESISEASEKTGINEASIGSCCKKRPHYNTAGGFIWRYAS